MTTTELLDLLRQAYDGDPWHGPSLKAVLTRVSAEHASVRPLSGRHRIGPDWSKASGTPPEW